ncbi:hypothetical protein [Nocardia nova]|uniref:hypothetical protein n=1 Tax=Nocardia nova TaxID=37330 RepID=UPI003411373F
MNESERYELVYNPATQEPVGVTDMSQPGALPVADLAPQQSSRPVYRPTPLQMPVTTYRPAPTPRPIGVPARLYLYAVLGIFAAGVAAGCWLFGLRDQDAPTVVVCSAPGVQVAVLPAECGPPAGGEPR